MTPTTDSFPVAGTTLGAFATPRILLIADGSGADGLAAIDSVGASACGPIATAGACDRLAVGSYDAVLVELKADLGEHLDALLDRLDAEAHRGRLRGVVTLPADMIDPVAARITHPALTLLCAPRPLERSAALGLAMTASAKILFHDVGTEGAVRLRQLSEEVGRIARTLASLSAGESAPIPRASATRDVGGDVPLPEPATIRAMLRARRLRAQFFDEALFADPAWDMLLDLSAARLEGTPVSVSSLCIAAAVPPTTALRWIKTLTDVGLLTRVADPRDRRRVYLELDDGAARAMYAYVAALSRIQFNP